MTKNWHTCQSPYGMTVHDRCIVKPHVKPFYPELRMLPYEHEKILTFNRKTKGKKKTEKAK